MIQAFININALKQSISPTMKVHGYIMEGGKDVSTIPYWGHWNIWLICSDYTKGRFIIRAMTDAEMLKLKAEVTNCFKAAALSTRCKLKIAEKMEYKGTYFLWS